MLRISVKIRLTGGEKFFLFKSGENPVNNRFLTGGKNRLITGFSPDLSGGEMVRLVNRTIFACLFLLMLGWLLSVEVGDVGLSTQHLIIDVMAIGYIAH